MHIRNKILMLATVGLACIPSMAAARDQLRAVGSSTVYPFATAVAERLARFKVPKHVFLVSAEEIPTTASGRARKFLLAEIAQRRIAAE